MFDHMLIIIWSIRK